MKSSAVASSGLALYAKGVVVCTLVLIFLGGLVTSWQAGMAVPDWPLSFGTLNPHNWWVMTDVRLEHGHRLVAAFVGLLITILCAAVWRNGWPLLWAALASGGLTFIARAAHVPALVIMHISIWSFALAFAVALLLARQDEAALPKVVRWLAFAAFVTVCAQATLGGLRVVLNNLQPAAAMFFRIAHGCLAQMMLCLLVIVAARLSPAWREPVAPDAPRFHRLRLLSWCATVVILLQLVVGATMRHQQAGLAISTFPYASPDGSWLPAMHTLPVELNFAHTRVGALVVTALVAVASLGVLATRGAGPRLQRLGWGMLALLGLQLFLGMLVVWRLKQPPELATLHVLNGAVLLVASLLFSLRLQRQSASSLPAPEALHAPSAALPVPHVS